MKMLEGGGVLPLMLPLTADETVLKECMDVCDGFLLTGGQDVSPSAYGEETVAECGTPCKERDRQDMFVLRHAVACDRPVLGICRGIQLMNVCFGGTLYQDLPTQHPSGVEHRMSPPYDRVVHEVEVLEGTLLYDIIGSGRIGVNSYHHQAIKALADGMESMAFSDDGLVEAVCMPGKRFIVGLQWHPEFLYATDERLSGHLSNLCVSNEICFLGTVCRFKNVCNA